MRNVRAVLLPTLAALPLFAAACEDEPAPATADPGPTVLPVTDAEFQDVVVSGPTARMVFEQDDDGWRLSPVLEAKGGATRAGFLVDLWEAPVGASDLVLEARGFDEDGQPTPWVPAEVTWAEPPYVVARADLDRWVEIVQFRVPEEVLDVIAYVTWAGVVPVVEEAEEDLAVSTQALSPGMDALGVMPRSAWQAKATKCTSKDSSKYRMAVHHTYTPTSSWGTYESRLRSIQTYHMDSNGWCDVGYHFLVTSDGTIWEGRPLAFRGAHVGGQNTGNIGISLVGCFEPGACESMGSGTEPSTAMLTGVSKALAQLSDDHDIALTSANVKGHGDHAGQNTSCPGKNVKKHLPALLAGTIAGGSAPGGSVPGAPPPPAPGRLLGVVWDQSKTASPSAPGNVRLVQAQVSVDGGLPVAVTGSGAFWSFEVPKGDHTVLASAPGYAPASRVLESIPGKDTWGSIGLFPEGAASVLTVVAFDASSPAFSTLDGAIVHVEGAGALETGADGVAVFSLPDDAAVVHVYAAGYVAKTLAAEVPPGSPKTLYAGLSPGKSTGATAKVQGVVFDLSATSGPSDPGNVRLDEAIVTCSCGLASVVRDGDAYWSFATPPGTWTFTAVAPGYSEATSQATVGGGAEAWASIGLLPGGNAE